MKDIPRSDAAYKRILNSGVHAIYEECQRLEREITNARKDIKRLEPAGDSMAAYTRNCDAAKWIEAIKRLIEVKDKLASVTIPNGNSHADWEKAKAAK